MMAALELTYGKCIITADTTFYELVQQALALQKDLYDVDCALSKILNAPSTDSDVCADDLAHNKFTKGIANFQATEPKKKYAHHIALLLAEHNTLVAALEGLKSTIYTPEDIRKRQP